MAAHVPAARGTGGAAGGGIWNGALLSGPPVELTLTKSPVSGNVLRAGDGLTAQGGGLFTTAPCRARVVADRRQTGRTSESAAA